MVIAKNKDSNSESSDYTSKSLTGQLIIIGGAEDKEDDCTILREFVRRAGGRKAVCVAKSS